jgi:hypothetical protein
MGGGGVTRGSIEISIFLSKKVVYLNSQAELEALFIIIAG